MPFCTQKKMKPISGKILKKGYGKVLLLLLLVASLAFSFGSALGSNSSNSPVVWRAKLLSNLIRTKFNADQYSHKKIDDTLSRAAFKLYIKQLDYEKRFLLQSDIKKLSKFSTKIDDEMNSGIIVLPKVANALLDRRISEVQKMANSILDKGFDFNRAEKLEMDPEKRNYAANLTELHDLWRKMLKYDVANRILTYEELAKTDAGNSSAGQKKEKAKETAGKKQGENYVAKAIDRVRKNYNEMFKRMLHLKEQEEYNRFFEAFTRAYDPHSAYLPPVQLEDFDIHMRGSLEGIGARLEEKDGYIKVVSIIPGGAAAKQGELQAEDIILKVGQGNAEPVDIVGMRIRDAVNLIRGKKGTTVKLTVKKSDGRIIVIPIVRDVVNIEETFVKHCILKTKKGARIGYILIPTFYRDFDSNPLENTGRNATDDVRKALIDLNKKKIDGLIVDLRNNGGGALIDAVDIAGLFIKKGPIVQIRESNGTIDVRDDDDPAVYYTGPMLVMVNEFSASASEIFAGAMQDYGRALIVGSPHTHGKGTVQALIDLDNSMLWPNMQKYKPLGALKITIQKFYRITGQSTQVKGIVPDIILPDPMEAMKYGEKYIPYALPWDTIPATKFTPTGSFADEIKLLREQSRNRIAHNKKFEQIEAEVKEAKQRSKHTERSLKLADIRRDREELEKIDKADRIAEGNGVDAAMSQTNSHKKLTVADEEKLWRRKLTADPYVTESENILADMKADSRLVQSTKKR